MALLRWRSVRRGLLGGSPAWTALAVALWLPRVWRRLTSARPEILTTQALRPGQSLSVSTSSRSRRADGRRGAADR